VIRKSICGVSFFEEFFKSPVHALPSYAYGCNLKVLEDLFTISVGKLLKTCLKVNSKGLHCRMDSKVPNSCALASLKISNGYQFFMEWRRKPGEA
jgi:hypothetical protein